MRTIVVYIQDFYAHWDYNAKVQVYAILGGKEPIIVYLYESSGYYNCYDHLGAMLRREMAEEYETDIPVAIPTLIADAEEYKEEFHQILIDTFTKLPTNNEE